MNREMILEHLALIEQRMGNGECEAMRLRQSLTRLERAGEATVDARQTLQACEQSQALHRAERTRLLAELSAFGAVGTDADAASKAKSYRRAVGSTPTEAAALAADAELTTG